MPHSSASDGLAAKKEVIDEALLLALEQVAEDMANQSRQLTADWLLNLTNELATYLGVQATSHKWKAYQTFLVDVLEAIEKNPDPQVMYPFLAANQDKLNDNLAYVLQIWAMGTLPYLEEISAQYTAAFIVDFSNLVQGFEQGNSASHMEIAIVGYQVAATVFTRDHRRWRLPHRFPYEWATNDAK
ncbi:hypothetical protein [Brasilonema bromeliae]|uniref:Phycocyanin n=1 Tax=Brasilonema bromeliae SPC951 TaxID=385972 RepID=A0ABX1P8W6_9CYAN|nr:hypothetical protein [Brasilonema bromeliae]NMG20863.1 hypothetical protein [Brasilonema bromeliae SPC951]